MRNLVPKQVFQSTDALNKAVCDYHDEVLYGTKRSAIYDHKPIYGLYVAICATQRRLNREYAEKRKTGEISADLRSH